MKFTCSVDIQLPRNRVVELFDNPENLSKWQDGFLRMEHLSGDPGTEGARSKLVYQMGKKEMELIETILENKLPETFFGRYEAKSMVNTMRNHFIAIDSGTTRYDAEIDYLTIYGIAPKLMAFFMPGLFRKQVQKWLDQFKAFAEREG